ncbi:MAG: hypothetical protein IJ776_09505 [Paludibacteraceae bacterium]|nr:hypothetical protein [Paludibacteraceae bacterium]
MQIFPNGTLRYASATAGSDLDENGNPIPACDADMNEIECTITAQSENRQGRYEDGQYKNGSYSVTCDMEKVGKSFNPKTIQLIHEFKGYLGDFQVQRIEYYKLTGTIEIWV